MAKIVWIALLALAGIYGSGYLSLNESSVLHYLDKLEELTMNGESHSVCDLYADDIKVSVLDHTVPRQGKLEGGKEELCEQTKAGAAAYTLLKPSTTVQRDDFIVKRSWLHPWTADVTYTEHRTISITQANIQRKTESDDKLTLVKTFGGVKILRLESENWLEE